MAKCNKCGTDTVLSECPNCGKSIVQEATEVKKELKKKGTK